MAGSPFLNAFINDFANNPRALREMGYQPTDQRLQLLKNESSLENSKIWHEVEATPQLWQVVRDWLKNGRGVEQKFNDWIVGGVVALKRLETPLADGTQFVAVAGRIVLLDENLSFVSYKGAVGAPAPASDPTFYANVSDIAIDEVNDRIAVVCGYPYNMVRVYTFSTFSHLFDVGTYYTYHADPTTGYLYYPISVAWHPNGNLLIANLNGGPDNFGHISEYDGQTGAYVQTLLDSGANGAPKGEPWNGGGIYRPYRIYVKHTQNNEPRLWVSSIDYPNYNYRDWVAEFDLLSTGRPEFIRAFREPDEYGFGQLSARDFVVDYVNDQITVANSVDGAIVTINMTSRDLLGVSGVYDVLPSDRPQIADTESPHSMQTPSAIAPFDSGGKMFYVGTLNRRGIMPVWYQNEIEVPYDISTVPEGYRETAFSKALWGLDENGIRKAPVWKLNDADKITLLLERVY